MQIHHGDCLDVLKTLPDDSIDAVVTDPPYGLQFMNKHWDHGLPDSSVWVEVLRVLKPGGHMCCSGGSRTFHRLAVAIEDAGFEIRDTIMWVYATGFPKSLDVAKAIDKQLGAEREVIERRKAPVGFDVESQGGGGWKTGEVAITAPATTEAAAWQGWGTALKPAHEPIILARKPLSEATVARNVLRWGTGAINVDASRVATDELKSGVYRRANGVVYDCAHAKTEGAQMCGEFTYDGSKGRWPANLIHDGSDEVLDAFAVYGESKSSDRPRFNKAHTSGSMENPISERVTKGHKDEGTAARFFMCAKASKRDRAGTRHPTVKPIKLLEYLCTLITPPGGTVLDPFAGSGTTGEAAIACGFDPILIEKELEYYEDIQRRFVVFAYSPCEAT